MTKPQRDVHRAIEAVARHSYGRLVAYLASRTGDVAGAEDALGDALVAALTKWSSDGVPTSPEAWLLTTARNRLIDRSRHERVRDRVHERVYDTAAIDLLARHADEAAQSDPFPDDRLKLLFVCAHPAIDPAMHTPLMLQAVLGLDAAAIARAFVVASATMSQRLVRAKAKVRETGIAFEVPESDQLAERLDAVLNTIYAAFGSGWDAPGADTAAVGLTDEAIWLARLLNERLPDAPEVRGLLALMLHCEARRSARRGADGRFIPLSAQDPGLWDVTLIAEAERELALAGAAQRPGRFQLEAAIQSAHAERARTGRTDWPAIATLYEGLVRIAPTLGAHVGRAAAVAEAHGAAHALELLDGVDSHAAAAYQPYWAVRAHVLQRASRGNQAVAAFDRASALTADPAVKAFLRQNRDALPH